MGGNRMFQKCMCSRDRWHTLLESKDARLQQAALKDKEKMALTTGKKLYWIAGDKAPVNRQDKAKMVFIIGKMIAALVVLLCSLILDSQLLYVCRICPWKFVDIKLAH